MLGKGYVSHLGKDKFEVTDVGVGRDFKKIQVKLLKKDMQDILKKYGRDSSGKKYEVIEKFIEFAKKVPKLLNTEPKEKFASEPNLYEIIKDRKKTQPISLSLDTFKDRKPLKIGPAVVRHDVIPSTIKPKQRIVGPIVSVPIPEEVKVPLSVREEAKVVSRAPTPTRPRYKHRFSDVGYNADRYTEDEILRLMADENSPNYQTEEQRQIKRLAFNKIVNENRKKNKEFIGNWIINGERYNSKTGEYHALK